MKETGIPALGELTFYAVNTITAWPPASHPITWPEFQSLESEPGVQSFECMTDPLGLRNQTQNTEHGACPPLIQN